MVCESSNTIEDHGGDVNVALFGPNGSFLLTASADGTAHYI